MNNTLKTAFLLGLLLALCMLVGQALGGPRGMLMGLIFGSIGNLIGYFFSDKIALASMGAREIGESDLPWLHSMVRSLCQRAELPMPRLYVCPGKAPNAFATGRNPNNAAVAITEGMLESFPQQEIEGVIAHELGHVKNRDVLISTIAAVLAGVIGYAAHMFMFFGHAGDDRDGRNPLSFIAVLFTIILAPIAATLIQLAISRSREFAADSFSGQVSGDPLKLASALERLGKLNQRIPSSFNPGYHALMIVEPLSAGRNLASLFSTHPPVEQRIAELYKQAGYQSNPRLNFGVSS